MVFSLLFLLPHESSKARGMFVFATTVEIWLHVFIRHEPSTIEDCGPRLGDWMMQIFFELKKALFDFMNNKKYAPLITGWGREKISNVFLFYINLPITSIFFLLKITGTLV